MLRSVGDIAAHSFFEQDLLWFIPPVYESIKQLSGWELIKFLLNPAPIMYGMAWTKIYSFFVISLFGPVTKYFIMTSLAVHIASSFLFFLLVRQLGYTLRAAWFAAITYLGLYAIHGVYTWPMSFQHLIATFFIIAVFLLYVKTDRLQTSGRSYKSWYVTTLIVNFMATFCRVSILILPLCIFADIIFASKNTEERNKRYNMWLPLLVIYLGYPLMTLTYVGDNRVNLYLACGNHYLSYLMFVLIGLGALFAVRRLLRSTSSSQARDRRMYGPIVALAVGFIIYGLLVYRDVRNLLLPYNILVPLGALAASFFNPLHNVLLNDSTRPYHFIALQTGPITLLLALLLVVTLARDVMVRKRLIIFVPWYLLAFVYVNLRAPIASRYLVYFAPLLCVAFASLVDRFYSQWVIANKRSIKLFLEILLLLTFIMIIFINVIAVRLDLARSRLANNLLIYDQIRTASLIQHDITANYNLALIDPKVIHINNIKSAPFETYVGMTSKNGMCYDIRFAMASAFGQGGFASIEINTRPSTSEKNAVIYTVEGDAIVRSDKGDIEEFVTLTDEGRKALLIKDMSRAFSFFEKAITLKPFLLRYILPEKAVIADLYWITNTIDLRTWTGQIVTNYQVGPERNDIRQKVIDIDGLISREIDRYIVTLFYASYAKWTLGELETSDLLFSQIRFIDSNYSRIHSLLLAIPEMRSDKEMSEFLNRHGKLSFASDVTYRLTYEFERFIARLVLGIDVVKNKGFLRIAR